MADSISFYINGKKVKAKNGETIWDVSKREGNTIPHLCHSGKIGYRPDGNCRAVSYTHLTLPTILLV